MNFPKKLIGLAALFSVSASAWGLTPFKVSDIRVEGIQRTEAGTVFSYLPIKVGDVMNQGKSANAIKALYATGFFKDVRLEVDKGGVLVVAVEEKPSIASISIVGVEDFPEEQLKDGMKYAGLAEARIFDKAVLDKAVQELKRQYMARGKYGVQISTAVSQLERNRVAIAFKVEEGDVAKIKHINLVGNQVFAEDELLDLMKLSTPDWLSWFNKNDQYSKQKLSADMEALRSHYMDSGYLEFNIDSTQVSITPDKQDIYITINFTEGEKYTISRIDVSGGNIIPDQELRELVEVDPGDVFSRKALTETSKKIGDRLGKQGYAFANINAVPDLDKENHKVAFNFVVDPGQRVYVRRINVEGNSKTRDEVIRREFRQVEGAWFDMDKIKRSKQRVDRLDFFSDVSMETPAVSGTTDQLDVNIKVEEKSTGSITMGAGFSDGEGFVLSGGITQSNFLGTGNHVSTQVNTSKVNQVYSFSYTNPYWTDDGVSRGFDVYKRNTDSRTTSVSRYSTHSVGAGIRFGVPIAEDQRVNFGLKTERTSIGLVEDSPQRMHQYVEDFGKTNQSLTLTAGWSSDSRDSAIYTTEGRVQRFYGEVALPVMDMRYYKVNYEHQYFYPINERFTLMLNTELGYADGYENKDVPFFKNFYAGGTGSVRGYESSSLGPRDDEDAALGGTRRVIGNIEFLTPIPGMEKNKSVRLSAFVDGGAVYGSGEKVTDEGLRFSTGIAVTWISPVGPMKISYGIPLNQKSEDKIQRAQFTLGSVF